MKVSLLQRHYLPREYMIFVVIVEVSRERPSVIWGAVLSVSSIWKRRMRGKKALIKTWICPGCVGV